MDHGCIAAAIKNFLFSAPGTSRRSLWTSSEPNGTQIAACRRFFLCLLVSLCTASLANFEAGAETIGVRVQRCQADIAA